MTVVRVIAVQGKKTCGAALPGEGGGGAVRVDGRRRRNSPKKWISSAMPRTVKSTGIIAVISDSGWPRRARMASISTTVPPDCTTARATSTQERKRAQNRTPISRKLQGSSRRRS